MTSRKKPGVAFWATVVAVMALVAYPLSIGPVSGVLTLLGNPDWPRPAFLSFYAPIIWLYTQGPQPIQDAIQWYLDCWGG